MKCEKCGRDNLTAKELAVHRRYFHTSYQQQVKTILSGSCPDCGGNLQYQEGCATCLACGYSKCG